MPKAILEFNLPEETEEFEDAKNGAMYKWQMEDVWQRIFRPRHKHLYSNDAINAIVESPEGEKLMEFLEQIFLDIRNEE